jgi:hypothetical protein
MWQTDLYSLYQDSWDELAKGPCADIPEDLRCGFHPVLSSLLCQDPARRGSVEEMLQNEWLMNEDDGAT